MTASAPAASPVPPQVLLAHHRRQLKLPTFLREYERLAAEAAREGLDHVRFLLRLAELELIDRERRMVERRIRAARFPAVKSFDTFDFAAIPSLNKPLVLDMRSISTASSNGCSPCCFDSRTCGRGRLRANPFGKRLSMGPAGAMACPGPRAGRRLFHGVKAGPIGVVRENGIRRISRIFLRCVRPFCKQLLDLILDQGLFRKSRSG